MKKSVREERIVWAEVARRVNKKLGKKYTPGYLCNIYNGLQKSEKVFAEIENVLTE